MTMHISAACRSLALCLVCGAVFTSTSQADRLELVGGGHVDGEVINRDRTEKEPYIVRTKFGKVTVKYADVKRAKLLRKEQQLYQRYLRKIKSADDHWKMAEWCKKQNLLPERRHHLNEVVRLEPDHELAHRALKHVQRNGKWESREELMNRRGFVRYKREWRLAQEVEILEAKEKEETARREYRNQFKRWKGWFGKRREPEAVAGINQVNDPLAVGAIAEQLKREKNENAIRLYVAALGRIGTPAATRSLIDLALATEDEELRIACLEKIRTPDQVELATSVFVAALESPENKMVHRAAKALAEIESHAAILPLIDALVTTHKFKVGADQEGRIAPTFSNGPGGSSGGLSMGGKAKIKKIPMKNRPVLRALLALTDGVNFEFDQTQWRSWWEGLHTPENFNLRRDA